MRDFNHTINVLVKAYLNDTLEHGNCYACAVGNLVAHAKGYSYTRCVDRCTKRFALVENNGLYSPGDICVGGYWYEFMTEGSKYKFAIDEINSTGYTFNELGKIECAFESEPEGNSEDEWMFNGLMAVVDVLADIHGIDIEVREETKKLFVK